LLISVTSVFAQKSTFEPVPQLWEDTAINPHDFTDAFYLMQGINPKNIIGRRNGEDGLSVISYSSNPNHTSVRVIATIPAYDENGDMIFWYPLGELQGYAFTDDKVGMMLRDTAMNYPIYVFPKTNVAEFRTFANSRQAALMDNSYDPTRRKDINMLGVRLIVTVNYTEKAFSKEGYEMMLYLTKKNGKAADDTPIIRTRDDLIMLEKNGMVDLSRAKFFGGEFAINPTIFDPTNGAIASDAVLWMATKDEKPLPAEDLFVWQFHCLQKTGNWCSQ
jgi:hypothetical protein